MVYLVAIFLVFSFILNVVLNARVKAHRKEVKYIAKKLQSIVETDSDEKLLLHTDDDEVMNLLIQINDLLGHNQKIKANSHRVERSMRKMLSNISHDLKTPLTVVHGYTEIMLNDEEVNNEKRKVLLETVHSKTLEVLDLIERFFKLVKLESGDQKFEIIKIDISEICRKVILYYYEILTMKEYEVEIEIPDESIHVWGNELELERVLHNLISNAIHHGEAGKMLGLKVHTINDCAYIEISDKGQGISEIHRDRVFERMYTMDDSRNKYFQGSGLGLTITKRLVEQMGGAISLQSAPYKKTIFTVKLNRFIF
ncbi:sensor histidine kinase [Bacillus sp. JJ722]|uniref:sensor histidine kinase n=1 Tax=Bacillus sp. JJ722 TaxID=3122973 RepID=UPI0030007663